MQTSRAFFVILLALVAVLCGISAGCSAPAGRNPRPTSPGASPSASPAAPEGETATDLFTPSAALGLGYDAQRKSYLFGVGVDVQDITPPVELGAVFLQGYYYNHPTKVVAKRISARSIALQDAAANRVVLVSVDVLGLDPDFIERVRDRIPADAGGAPTILVNSTHTHTAPVVRRDLVAAPRRGEPNQRYMSFLEDQVVLSIERAIQDVHPSTLHFARGESDAGVNRHELKMGRKQSADAYDRTLDVLVARAKEDGHARVIAFFYGCHPVSRGWSDNRIHPDYPGDVRDALEQAEIADVAVFFQGFGGDVNPRKGVGPIADRLRDDVVRLARGDMIAIAGGIDANVASVDLSLAGRVDDLAAHVDSSERAARWKKLWARGVPAALRTEVATVRIGDQESSWRLVTSAHEIVTEYAPRFRALFPDRRVTLAGYTGGVKSYLPTPEILRDRPKSSNYEGYTSFGKYGLPAPFTERVEEQLREGLALLDRGNAL